LRVENFLEEVGRIKPTCRSCATAELPHLQLFREKYGVGQKQPAGFQLSFSLLLAFF